MVAKAEKIRDQLHDVIDFVEGARNSTAELVKKIIQDNLEQALEKTGDIEAAMQMLAQEVEEELTDVTTEVFQTSAELAKARYS